MKKLFYNQKTFETKGLTMFLCQFLSKPTFVIVLMLSFFFFCSSCSKKDVTTETEPLITGFQPDVADVGDHVDIKGTGFGTTGEILFGDNILSSDNWTDTSVLFTIPSGYENTEQKIGLRINGKDYFAGTISVHFTEICITPDADASVGCWSKDGKQVFFIRMINYEFDIYSVPWTGGEIKLVKHIPGDELFLDVSFVSGDFIFCSETDCAPNKPFKIYTGNESLTSIHHLTVASEICDPVVERQPTWNSYGGYPFYAWVSLDEAHYISTIYVANNSQAEKIGEGYCPRFNPMAVYCSQLAYNVKTEDGGWAIVIKSFAGSGSDRDTLVSGKDILPGFDWSVSGRIAYCKKGPAGIGKDIWVVNANGTDNHALIATDSEESEPRWSPDGHYLLFTRFTRDFHLYVAYTP